jgi:chemotaxis protein methyltransferase CheR
VTTDGALVDFLSWAVPRLGLRWKGVAHFRRTVRKRLIKRMTALGLSDLADYRALLERDATELLRLEAMCRIPISRLYRDRAVYDVLASDVLPERAQAALREGRSSVRIWSAGCASGEEPYTLGMIWYADIALAFPSLSLDLVATDADEGMLARARSGVYGHGSVRELPARLRSFGLQSAQGGLLRVADAVREGITFRCEDVRVAMPDGTFDLVLCRNMLLTYVAEERQPAVLERIATHLLPGGSLVVGRRETMPAQVTWFEPDPRAPGLFRVTSRRASPQ